MLFKAIVLGLFVASFALTPIWEDAKTIESIDDEPSVSPGEKLGKKDEDFDDGEEENSKELVGLPDFLAPKYRPGEVLKGSTSKDVNRALDEIMKAGKIMHDRTVSIGTANVKGRSLVNPRYYLRRGMASSSPAYEITPGRTSLKLFVKKDWTATGTGGVVTYDIEGTEHKVAIMWMVPFDFNLYDVWFNVKVYPKSYGESRHMYDQMYKWAGSWRARGWEERTEYGVNVKATMTHNIHAKLQVYIDSSNYDSEGPIEHFADCSYQGSWVGHYCWKDCHAGGYCWIKTKCKKAHQCTAGMKCSKGCKKTP